MSRRESEAATPLRLGELIEQAIGLSPVEMSAELRDLIGDDIEADRRSVRRVLGRHVSDRAQLEAALVTLYGDHDARLDGKARALRRAVVDLVLAVVAGLLAQTIAPGRDR
ncbi:hypothetical protein [Haliangium sp.]|uniref:hypothetical protein n=1 Tax=Haliangium sp. TaxID=2663208 RepID=UPI003D14E4A4